MGETLQKIFLCKAVPDGLKPINYEQGIEDKNSPICYILEQDPILDALEAKHQSAYFKLTFLKLLMR